MRARLHKVAPLLVAAIAMSDDSLIAFFLSVTFMGCSTEESNMWRVVIHFLINSCFTMSYVFILTLVSVFEYPSSSILSVTETLARKERERERERAKMIRTALLFVALLVGRSVHAQLIPPPRRDGFVYPPGGRIDPDTILIEAYFDPVCPDCKDAWEPLKLAVDHYGSRVALVIHLMPLPFHDNAFVVSRALHIVDTINTNATISFLEGIFKHQALFYNSQTQFMPRPAVVDKLVKLGTVTLGSSFHYPLKSGFRNSQSDLATRVSFKYSVSRGVSSTPTFYVNGFELPDAGSPIDFEGWKNTIDPLVKPREVKIKDTFLSFLTQPSY